MKLRRPNPQGPRVKKAIRWTWFYARGEYNDRIRQATRGECGCYAFRTKRNHTPLYVGESHSGRLWKTTIRHFHGLDSFEQVGEWTHEDRTSVEVMIWLTYDGDDAIELERLLQRRLRPIYVERIPEDDDEEEAPF